MSDRMRLAYFSPLPPARTGIADYSLELLPALRQLADLTLFVEEPAALAAELHEQFDVQPLSSYGRQRWDYDLALYQMGNSLYHEALYRTMLRYPGVVVLHDYTLHHFHAAWSVDRQDFAGYSREMGYALGLEGVRLAWEARLGRSNYPLFDFPLNNRALDVSLGAIVHSQYTASQVAGQHPALPVRVVPAPIANLATRATMRARLGWPPESVIFASVGQATASKKLDLALKAFAQLRQERPESRYLLIGELIQAEFDVPETLRALGLAEGVRATGFVASLPAFADWIAAADVVLNLRYPTVGETSATALRALAAGRPLIVFDHGWYSELPDDVCLKVPVMDEQALLTAMRRLAEDHELRQQMGQRAAAYARQHQPERVAAAYIEFLGELRETFRGMVHFQGEIG
jgi:glycosyltransferase involved in cell wall biosynthesis